MIRYHAGDWSLTREAHERPRLAVQASREGGRDTVEQTNQPCFYIGLLACGTLGSRDTVE